MNNLPWINKNGISISRQKYKNQYYLIVIREYKELKYLLCDTNKKPLILSDELSLKILKQSKIILNLIKNLYYHYKFFSVLHLTFCLYWCIIV